MPTVQQIGLPRRSMLARVIYLVPAFVVSAMIMGTLSCRTTGSGGGGSGATATPTPGTGALAFVTNYNDGMVSSFTRNTTTGVLKHTGQVTAGSKSGPRGVVASPNGEFLYVANIADDNIYEFSVSQTKGTLTSLAKVPNGSGTGPDELAINSNGTLLWVTNRNKGTVGWYTVNPSTGLINASSQGSIGGFNKPFGITLHPTLTELYVSDTVTGLIQPMSYNTSTGVLSKNFPAAHSSDVNADTPAAIAINTAGTALFIADQKLGEVSSFLIDGTGALTSILVFQNSNVSDTPVGVGIAVNNAVEYLFTANQGLLNTVPGSVSSFITSGTTVITPPQTVPLSGGALYNGPTGLVVDPQNQFVYTADNFDGTVSQSAIGVNALCATQICEVGLVSAESPHKANSGPFGITLAQ